MKKQNLLHAWLGIFATGAVMAIVTALLTALLGLILGWQLAVQYSNGMFIAGSMVVILGVAAVWGGFTARGSFAITYAQSVSDMSIAERGKLWMLDSLRGYNAVVVSAISGLLLIGLSILIYSLFG